MSDLAKKVGKIQIARTIPVVTIKIGTAVRIEFADTDGGFEIHYDTAEHPGQLIVKETDGLPDSYERTGILYCEEFGVVDACAPTEVGISATAEVSDNEWGEDHTFAIYWRSGKCWYNREEQAWSHDRISACEFDSPIDANERAIKLLKNLDMVEQFTIVRSDQQ